MKASVLLILSTIVVAPAIAQTGPASPSAATTAVPRQMPMAPTGAPLTAAPASLPVPVSTDTSKLLPPPANRPVVPFNGQPTAAAPGVLPPTGNAGMPSAANGPVSTKSRNPLKPPTAGLTTPLSPGIGGTDLTQGTRFNQGLPPLATDPADTAKSNGKRIGTIDGKAIYRQEESYYFDTEPEKHLKK